MFLAHQELIILPYENSYVLLVLKRNVVGLGFCPVTKLVNVLVNTEKEMDRWMNRWIAECSERQIDTAGF